MSQVAKRQIEQGITRENHALPVCYQLAFTSTDERLWVQFLDKEMPISLHPRTVGKLNDFYTQTIDGIDNDGVEKFFNKFVESQFANVARRIKDEKAEFVLQPADVPVLLKFVAAQIVRTESHRDCINVQAGIKVPQGVFIHNMHRKMKMIADRWTRHMPDVVLWTSLPHLRSQFIMGDNPVLCFSHSDDSGVSSLPPMPKIIDLKVSLESSQSRFTVPLSPYICLTVINSGNRDKITLKPAQCADPRAVRDINQMIYNQCVRFVAAQEPEFLRLHNKK
jgi:Protein of unknown function (DUF4238)